MRVVFFGTPDFATPFLQTLIDDPDIEVVAVVSQPDKPSGRKMEIKATPVKTVAQSASIEVLQPKTLRSADVTKSLRQLTADVFVVVAYGKLIPKSILDIPAHGCVNVHPSLLPRHRGPSPVQFTILEGDAEAGISIMILDEEMDTGPTLAIESIDIDERETYTSLRNKITERGPSLLVETLKQYVRGTCLPTPQSTDGITVTRMLTKDDGHIDWTRSTQAIDRQIRALQPWPSTWVLWDEHRLKIIKAQPSETSSSAPGRVSVDADRLLIDTADAQLEILEVQPEGKQKMSAKDFVRGYQNIHGAQLS